MSAEVAVAVVSWNTRELLCACLDSLRPEVEAGRAEAWVVDNGSTDGSPAVVAEDYGWANLLTPSRNLGFGPAVNEVAARTTAPALAPANADIAFAPGALSVLLEELWKPDVGVVAPRLILPDGSTQHSVHSFPTVGLSVIFGLGLYRLSRDWADQLCIEGSWDPDRPRRVDWAHGALFVVRREAFQAAGGFDPEQWMYAEDLDLNWRLAQDGWVTRYEPRARVEHHLSAATTQAFGDERLDRYMAASYDWMVRRRGTMIARSFAAVNLIAVLGRFVLAAPLARIWPARWGRRAAAARAYLRIHARGLAARGLPAGSQAAARRASASR